MENTRNDDDLRNMLRVIKAFSEFYWVQLPRKRLTGFNMLTWTPKKDRHAVSVTRETIPVPFVQGPSRCSQEKEKTTIFQGKLRDLVVVLPNDTTFCASPDPLGVQPMHLSHTNMA